MPARRLHRVLRPHTAPSLVPLVSGDSSSNKYSALGTTSIYSLKLPPAPKHIPFNCSIVDGDLVFELRMFLYSTLGAAFQFLHLYRSVWWLPYTHNNYPINYFLIDPFLVGFILVLLFRRLIYGSTSWLLEMWLPEHSIETARFYFRVGLFAVMVIVLLWCACHIMQNNQMVNVLYLCYPLFVYLILFGFQLLPFFEMVTMNSNGLPPLHACTNVAKDIRSEVEELKLNFNCRVKQILFNSLLNTYYAGMLPCCFVHNFINYDVNWATQHMCVIWFGSFTSFTVHALPVRYCDTLHRSALHLGYWDKVPPNFHSLIVHPWHDDTLWPFGAIVKHGKDTYRSLGEVNVAEPGNSSFTRFYTFFWNPPLPFSILLVIQAGLVLFQLLLLLRSYSCWYYTVSASLLLVFNYYTLYTIGRNFFVSQRLYNLEQAMHEKTTN